jgi:formamidopyrimidine-DNA glycosylase
MFETAILKKKNLDKPIGIVLLDQKNISGIGNYLRADCLWLAKISPFRKVKDLSVGDLKKLFYSVRLLIWGSYNYKKAIKLKIIKKSDKLPSDYNRYFFVYDNDKDINGKYVTKEKLYEGSQIRYIYWVKGYQK